MFTVPKSAGSKRQNRFAFRIAEGGKVYSVPFLQYLSGRGATFIQSGIESKLDEASLTRGLIALECPEVAEAIEGLSIDQIGALSKAWADASTVSLGELPGSES
ncbi:hypothetical protein AWN90_11445 [Nocardia terpenica]|uniref:Uncharacterized protein n=1 Tax=Nocardia terpenica TaxID=455432 RepID=A0A164HFW0_9NOCA|nr:hypothetical protein AWN90_11445 [Nocardia terpenica]